MQHIGKQINKQGEIGLKQTNNVHPLKKAYRKTRQDSTVHTWSYTLVDRSNTGMKIVKSGASASGHVGQAVRLKTILYHNKKSQNTQERKE